MTRRINDGIREGAKDEAGGEGFEFLERGENVRVWVAGGGHHGPEGDGVGATTCSEAGWFVGSADCGEDGDEFLFVPSTGFATSSDSRLTGSPIVVSFANFDSDGLSIFLDLIDVG